jgi:membrane fusion protein (multidrug efflux system)
MYFPQARRNGEQMMAEGVNRPSRTVPHSPDLPEHVMADQKARVHDEMKDQHRRPPVTPPSDDGLEELPKTRQPFYKRPFLLAAAAVVLIIAALALVHYYNYAVSHEWTDDAFIEGHLTQISAKVAGRVAQVHVTDNQKVTQGDLLVEIDSSDYAVRLSQARAVLQAAMARQQAAQSNVGVVQVTSDAGIQQAAAGLELATAAVQTARAQVGTARSRFDQAVAQIETAAANAAQARAQILAAEAEATRADADVKRLQELSKRDQVSRQDLDQAIATTRVANAQLEAARKRAAATEAQVAEARAAQRMAAESLHQAESQVAEAQARVGEAQGRLAAAHAGPHQVAMSQSQAELASAEVEQARAAVEQSELELSYTKISAPASGRVTRRTAEVGAYAQVGQALMTIVPDDVWVMANFKETQLTDIRPGQPAEIWVDAYPELVFKGYVDSVQAGTGARFSLLPPENATGNFIKVVQRVPVKIVFDGPPDPDHLLGPGMSVVPVVKVR